jgi:hypothetical protein
MHQLLNRVEKSAGDESFNLNIWWNLNMLRGALKEESSWPGPVNLIGQSFQDSSFHSIKVSMTIHSFGKRMRLTIKEPDTAKISTSG